MFFIKNSNTTKHFFIIPPVFLSCFLMVISSCTHPGNLSLSGYDKVLDSANHLFDSGHQQQAIHYLDSASVGYTNIKVLQKFYYYVLKYDYAYHVKRDTERSMLYADSMINLFDTPEKKLKYNPQYGQAHFFKGDILFDQNKYGDAYQYFYQGKLIANNSLDDCTLSEYSYRMGMIMYKQEHFQAAAENFKNSSREISKCELNFRSFYRRQELLNNVGLSYSKINQPDSAIAYFKKAIDYINAGAIKFKDEVQLLDVARGVIYGNEASIYIQKNNYTQAKNLLKKSININLKKGNDNRDAQLSELKLVRIFYEQNRIDSMNYLLKNIQRQFDTIKNQDIEADWNRFMSNYYIKKNNPKAAIAYFKRYDALKDTITHKNKVLKEADINEQIKRVEKEYEFNNLKKNNRSQRTYLKLSVVLGIMFVVIIFLILLYWQKSHKNLKVLGSLNCKINDQNTHLENALEELNYSSREKDRILRTVAHDLRNPLGGIASLSRAMVDDDDYKEEQLELLNLIRDTSDNSLELINEILEATDTSVKVLSREPIEINSLLSNSVELLRFKAAEKGQVINLELLKNPEELVISREKIWRVISNLISNAIKFSPADAIINIKINSTINEVTIAVIDNGIGIPEKMKNKVFNMFTEANRPGTAGEKSFGLGLSICQQIIENHNGKIWFESVVDKGTTFYISLPKTASA